MSRLVFRAKGRVRLASLIKRLLCRLPRSLNPKPWPFALKNFLVHFATLLKTKDLIL